VSHVQVESVQKDASILSQFGLTSVTNRLDFTSKVGVWVCGWVWSMDVQLVMSDGDDCSCPGGCNVSS